MHVTVPRLLGVGVLAAVLWATHEVASQPPPPAAATGTIAGVPAIAVMAYQEAARVAPAGCEIRPSLIAAIGAVESGHGTFGDSQPDPVTGQVVPPIRGPQLNGVEFAAIPDTDGGKLDGDPEWDRAVGPVQFIPTTWAYYADPDDDPQNLFDSAKNTARLLCSVATSEGRPITDPAVQSAAILAYNHSDEYVATVQDFESDFVRLGVDTPTAFATPAGRGDLTAGAVAAKLGETSRRHWEDLGAAIDRTGSNRVRPVFDAADPFARLLWNTLDSTPAQTLASRDAVATQAGTSATGTLAVVAGITVDGSIAGPLQDMIAAAAADGVALTGSGFRTNAEQVQLRREHCGSSDYAIYEMPPGDCSPPTAIPGTSNHETGQAIDFRDGNGVSLSYGSPGYEWMNANAARFGLHNLPSEPWHWSVDGR